MKHRVAVLMGGRSSEHEISLVSGKKVLDTLVEAGSEPVKVVILKDGRWSIDGTPEPTLGRALDRVKEKADVVFIAMHGENGEDGTIQGLFEIMGLPYTGSGVLGSSLAMDKIRAKLIYQARGLPTADFEAIDRARFARESDAALRSVEQRLKFPCVVKPACAGSSVGVSFPKDKTSLDAALRSLLAKVDLVLVEPYLPGREFTCGVVAFDREARVQALPVTEIIPDPKYQFFDYEAKYTPGASREVTPAEISPGTTERIQALSLDAHRWLGCRDFSRTDFRMDPSGQLWILETNTIPGLTPTSLLPQAAEVAGYTFRRVIEVLIDNAVQRALPA